LTALHVLAAGSLRPAFDQLGGGEEVVFAYANARDLAERIVAAERADVFASASAEHPARLHAAGLVEEPRAFACNRLVVAVPAASRARDAGVLAAPGTRVVIEVEGIPLGDYTRELLGRLDEELGEDYAARVLANVVRQEQTVDDVAARLLSGEADAAVLYATDVVSRAGELRAMEPPGVAVAVTCVVCVVSAGGEQERAAAWVEALRGPGGQEIMRGAGFEGPPAGGDASRTWSARA
jgi:molybdate transport system substrate-binding protein